MDDKAREELNKAIAEDIAKELLAIQLGSVDDALALLDEGYPHWLGEDFNDLVILALEAHRPA